MNAAKIRLSPEEMALLKDAGWILTKNRALEKIKDLLGSLLPAQQALLDEMKKPGLPEEVIAVSPKISRGENYQGLPWVILDHPRYFEKGNVFAVRTLFWWGQSFSVTLHLSGRYKAIYQQQLVRRFVSQPDEKAIGGDAHLCLCVNDKEWEHHFGKENYQPLGKMKPAARQHTLLEKPFLKLAWQIPLSQWGQPDTMENKLIRHFKSLLELLEREN